MISICVKCPYCKESVTSSFMFYPETEDYKCFACGIKGTGMNKIIDKALDVAVTVKFKNDGWTYLSEEGKKSNKKSSKNISGQLQWQPL